MTTARTFIHVSAMPGADTTVMLHKPDTHDDGEPRHITVVQVGPALTLQWTDPAEALAWLNRTHDLIADLVSLAKIEQAQRTNLVGQP